MRRSSPGGATPYRDSSLTTPIQPLSLKVTLLPEDTEVYASAAEVVKSTSRATLDAMLATVLDHAADLHQIPQQRYSGYSPESAFRSVRILMDYDLSDELLTLLEAHLQRFSQTLAGTLEAADPGARLESGTYPAHAASACFGLLITLWSRFVSAMEEIQTVWSVFSYQYLLRQASAKDMAGATIRYLQEPLWAARNVFEAGLEGFVAEVRADASTHRAPSMTAANDDVNEEVGGSASHCDETVAAKRHENLRRFTALALAGQTYVDHVQPAIVAALTAHYKEVALRMYGDGVPALDYFRYTETAMQTERLRCKTYLLSLTAPLLQQTVEEELLSSIGTEVARRDFGKMFTAVETDHTALSLIFSLFHRCTHVPRDPLQGIMQDYVQQRIRSLIERMIGPAPATPSVPTGVAETRRTAALALLRFVQCSRRVIASCVTPSEQKIYQVQLDEDLQDLFGTSEKPLAEQCATLVDHVFKDLENGVITLQSASSSSDVKRTRQESITTTAPELSSPTANVELCSDANEEPQQQPALSAWPSLQAKGVDTEDETGATILESVAFVCSHFPSKDLFEQLHWRDLGRRLLHPYRVVNRQAELYFLRLFEGIYGHSFISKYETMLMDMTTSEGISSQYTAWVAAKGRTVLTAPTPSPASAMQQAPVTDTDFEGLPPSLDVQLTLATSGCWPPYKPIALTLPTPLQRVVENVGLFYRRLYPNRILTWQHQLANGVLSAQLRPGGPIRQLSGTFIQCVVLLLLDRLLPGEGGSISVADLCQQLGVELESPEVVGALLGLCHDRFKVLLCVNSKGGSCVGQASLSSTDRLSLNTNFTAALNRVRMPFMLSLRPTDSSVASPTSAGSGNSSAPGGGSGDAAEGEEVVWRRRGYLLEVAIVRYMKASRAAKHEDLMEHIQSQPLPSQMSSALTKRAIEKLLDRGFLEREGTTGYKYVA